MAANAIQTRLQYFYNAYFGRPADPSGLRFWEAGIANTGKEIETAIKLFGDPNTPEFAQRYPAGTSTEVFLDTIYAQMFNRLPDAAGKQFWANAFKNWVNGGVYSEGEARAQIVVEVLNAALGQTGTNDKLATTNKQFVSNAMTESINLHGTESGFVGNLTKARALLASVDHTQESVNAAVARIKFGYVDGVDPVSGTPGTAALVVDLGDYEVGTVVELHSEWDKGAIVKIAESKDSAFGWVYKNFTDTETFITGINAANPGGWDSFHAAMTVIDFSVSKDVIDLSSFHLQKASYFSLGSTIPNNFLSGTYDSNAGISAPSANFKNHVGFFQGNMAVGVDFSNGAWKTGLFIDVDGNGNLDLGVDLFVNLSGVHPSQLSSANFLI